MESTTINQSYIISSDTLIDEILEPFRHVGLDREEPLRIMVCRLWLGSTVVVLYWCVCCDSRYFEVWSSHIYIVLAIV